MTTNMRPATAVKSARAPTFRFRSKALFEHIAGPLQAGAASLTLNKAPRVRSAWRLPAPQFLPLLLQGVAGGLLDLAHALLQATLELVGGAVGAELVVARGLADRVLDMAARLFARAFDFVLVHLTLLAWVGFNSPPAGNVPRPPFTSQSPLLFLTSRRHATLASQPKELAMSEGRYVVYGQKGSGSVPVEAALTLIGAPYEVIERS